MCSIVTQATPLIVWNCFLILAGFVSTSLLKPVSTARSTNTEPFGIDSSIPLVIFATVLTVGN